MKYTGQVNWILFIWQLCFYGIKEAGSPLYKILQDRVFTFNIVQKCTYSTTYST